MCIDIAGSLNALTVAAGLGDRRSLVIGEVAQAHDGSLGTAHAYIDAIASSGADAVKFQTHIAAAETTPAEPWRVVFSPQDATRYDYWKRMEFTESQWAGLKRHAEEKGLVFLSTPFSPEAVDLLQRLEVSAWKVASGEMGNRPLLHQMVETGLPILLSSGMSPLAEVDAAIAIVKEHGNPLAVLQCTSLYPCPPESVGLNLLPQFRSRYGCAVGLSDHSGTIYAGLAAAAYGADVIEVHVTLSRHSFGPDVTSSITVEELHSLVEGVRFIEAMLRQPTQKDDLASKSAPLRRAFTKSVVARRDLTAGTIVREADLALKKPGFGIPPERIEMLLGRRLVRDVPADDFLAESDVE